MVIDNNGQIQSKEDIEKRYAEIVEIDRISGNNMRERIYRRRTYNVAWAVVGFLRGVPFDVLEFTMYFQCDKEMRALVLMFEKQMELAKINEDKFRKNLHSFYCDLARKVKEEKLVPLFAEFLHTVVEYGAIRGFDENDTVRMVFSAYLSLVEQATCYMVDDLKENVCGLSSGGEILTVADSYPLIDYYQYDFEKNSLRALLAGMAGKRPKVDSEKEWRVVKKGFVDAGFKVNDFDDLNYIVQASNNFSNNLYCMMYWINERCLDIIPNGFHAGLSTWDRPRKWMNTEFYKERLVRRNYTLPVNGVVAQFNYAGAIEEILFKEVFKDDKVVLLWKVRFDFGGETAGYYDTKNNSFIATT